MRLICLFTPPVLHKMPLPLSLPNSILVSLPLALPLSICLYFA